MRALLEQLRACMSVGSADLELATQAIQSAAATIPAGGRFTESDLRDAIAATMNQLAESASGEAWLATTEVKMGELPGWDPLDPPGKFDLAFGPGDRDRMSSEASLLAEVKWSDHNTLSHSLWDAAKLVGGFAKCADHVVLVGGWPTARWDRAPCAALYQTGVVDYATLAAIPKEWPSLHKHSQGRALALPRELRVTELVTVPVTRSKENWELRAVRIEPAAAGWLWLNNGLVDGALPSRTEPNRSDATRPRPRHIRRRRTPSHGRGVHSRSITSEHSLQPTRPGWDAVRPRDKQHP